MNIAFGDSIQSALTRLPQFLPRLLRRDGDRFSIGLDLGPLAVNLVQLMRSQGKIRIRAIASVPYNCTREELYQHPRALKELLKQAYACQPFKGRHVVSCLPAEKIKIITVSYKIEEGQSDADAVVAELRERLQGELDDMVVDFRPLREKNLESGKSDALVALAPRKSVLAYLDLLGSSGLVADALDIGPAALARLVCHAGALRRPDAPLLSNTLLVNVGAGASFLTVLWGRRLILDRAVEFSENRLLARLRQVLDMPDELALRVLYQSDAGPTRNADGPDETERTLTEVLRPEINLLLQEINKTLVYMASKTRGKSVDIVYLAGRVARYPGIRKSLWEQLHVPVEILDPLAVFGAEADGPEGPDGLGTMAGIALTAGLALRGIAQDG